MTATELEARMSKLETLVERLAKACAEQRYGAANGCVYMHWTTKREFERVARGEVHADD